MSDEELLTTEEVAEIVKVGPPTVRVWINQGKLPAVDLDGSYRIYRKDLKEFLAQRYRRAGSSPQKKE
jgi:excisionase family DNA binding protein